MLNRELLSDPTFTNYLYLLFYARFVVSLSTVCPILMYFQVKMDDAVYFEVEDDTVFITKLFNEQSVMCLPASVSETITTMVTEVLFLNTQNLNVSQNLVKCFMTH